MNKTILSVIIAVVAIAGIWYLVSNTKPNNQARTDDTVVAKVNGVEIKQAALAAAEESIARAQGTTTTALSADQKTLLETEALNGLISQELVRQAVAKEGLTASSTVVDAELKRIKDQFNDQTAYVAALTQENLTEETLRKKISEELVAEEYFTGKVDLKNITVTDTEIEKFYNDSVQGNTTVPKLDEVRDQVKSIVLQEKQRAKILEHVESLRENATVEIFI